MPLEIWTIWQSDNFQSFKYSGGSNSNAFGIRMVYSSSVLVWTIRIPNHG